MYIIEFTPLATKDVLKLQRSQQQAYIKLKKLIGELKEHPKTGTGKPKQLSGDRSGQWSRRITDKHRLVYRIEETKIVVLVISAYGHYDEK